MSDLFLALNLFSNINIFKKKALNANGKYTLCYFPLVGVVVGAALVLWYILLKMLGFGIVAGIGLPVIIVIVTGKSHLWVLIEHFGVGGGTALYLIFSMVMLIHLSLQEVLVVAGVFVISRVMSVFLFIDCDYIENGIYRKLAEKSRRIVVSVITVVWLMATVAYIEMISLKYFIVFLISFFAIYFIFAKRAKDKCSLTDYDINMFIIISEAAALLEISLGKFVPVLINI